MTDINDPIFRDDTAALAHLEASRWGGRPSCPPCGSFKVRRMTGKTQTGMFLCNACRGKFTVRTGSVMERSHIPLHKWLLASHLMAEERNDVSARHLERALGVTYKTAWFLRKRIGEAGTELNAGGLRSGKKPAEVDPVDIGPDQVGRPIHLPPPDLADVSMGTLKNCVGASLRFTENEVFSRTSEMLAPLGLTPGSFTVLVLINENKEAIQGNIGARLLMKKSNFATLIARLERRGLVIRTSCTGDGRRQRLSLSDAGVALLGRAVELHDAFNASLRAHMGRAAHDKMIRLLEQLRNAPPFQGVPDKQGTDDRPSILLSQPF